MVGAFGQDYGEAVSPGVPRDMVNPLCRSGVSSYSIGNKSYPSHVDVMVDYTSLRHYWLLCGLAGFAPLTANPFDLIGEGELSISDYDQRCTSSHLAEDRPALAERRTTTADFENTIDSPGLSDRRIFG